MDDSNYTNIDNNSPHKVDNRPCEDYIPPIDPEIKLDKDGNSPHKVDNSPHKVDTESCNKLAGTNISNSNMGKDIPSKNFLFFSKYGHIINLLDIVYIRPLTFYTDNWETKEPIQKAFKDFWRYEVETRFGQTLRLRDRDKAALKDDYDKLINMLHDFEQYLLHYNIVHIYAGHQNYTPKRGR